MAGYAAGMSQKQAIAAKKQLNKSKGHKPKRKGLKIKVSPKEGNPF